MASEVIKLNLIPKGEMPVFHCSQFDNGRLINIELYRGEDAYTIPEGCTAELHCRKVDGNIVTIGSPVVDDNTIKFTSTTQLTACNGKNLCEVAILGADDYLIGSLNFWLDVEVDPLKGGINSTSEIHDLYEQIEDITAEVIGDDYYDKTEVDNLLDDKADKSTTYTKTQVDTLLTAKADTSNVYTKTETNTLLTAKADADNVYTKAQVETKLAAKANAATTYTKTEVDTALALKANAADVYTKAETDAAIDAAIDDILPVDTAGPSAIANFTTGLALPLVECKVGILAMGGNGTPETPNPINGYSSANITRCGVNIWDEQWEVGRFDTTTGANVISTTQIRSKNKFRIKGGVDYYIYLPPTLGRLYCIFYDANETVIPTPDVPQATSTSGNSVYLLYEFTAPQNACFMRFYCMAAYGTSYNNDISINYPATDTTYHAYNGQTYAVNFGQTVYGGILDAKSGKLKPCIEYPSYNGETLSGRWLSSEATYVEGTTPPTGSQVVSLDDYGTNIDLTPVQISALVGENNVFGDTNGDTTVKFKDTIQNYIDKKVST